MPLEPKPWAGLLKPWAEVEDLLKGSVAEHVKALRESLRPTGQTSGSAIAKYLGGGVVQSAVSQWLNANSFPDTKNIFALARRAKVTPGELLDHLCAEAGIFPEEAKKANKKYQSAQEQFRLMCEHASPDQMLEFQQIWLNECLSRRDDAN